MLYSYDLKYGDDYIVFNHTLTPSVDIDAPIVFVGYGITAPEFHWNDYANIDVKGKVILCIVGDPPSNDPNFFGGDALTYYGRWTYKFEQAARKGAVGALIIHRTDLASYGWDVVKNSNTSEKTYLRDNKDPQLEAASWIQLDVAKQIFKSANLDADAEIEAAGKRGFKAIELPVRLHAHVESIVRPFQSPNVIGILPGTANSAAVDGSHRDQAVLYTAHYDHLGFVPGMSGDNIYNGAADNATGCGMILEMARAWSPLRTVRQAPALHHLRRRHRRRAGPPRLRISRPASTHPHRPDRPRHQLRHDPSHRRPAQINVNGAQRTTFFPTVEATAKALRPRHRPRPHARPPAATTAPTTSPLARVGIPAFSLEPAASTKATTKPGPAPRAHEDFTAQRLPQLLRQLPRRLGLHRQRHSLPLRHRARLACPSRSHRHQLEPRRRVRSRPKSSSMRWSLE